MSFSALPMQWNQNTCGPVLTADRTRTKTSGINMRLTTLNGDDQRQSPAIGELVD